MQPLPQHHDRAMHQPMVLPMLGLLLLSIHLQAIAKLPVSTTQEVYLLGYDLITPLLAIGTLFVARQDRIGLPILAGLFLASAYLLGSALAAFASPIPVKALTLLGIMSRNLILLACCAVLVRRVSVDTFSRYFVATTGVLCAIAIIHYAYYAVALRATVLGNRDLWSPGLVYKVSQATVLRAMGYTHDPNFFASLAIPSLFVSLYHIVRDHRASLLYWFGAIAGGSAVLLSFSRSGLLLSASAWICTLVAVKTVGAGARAQGRNRSVKTKNWLWAGISLAGILGLLYISGILSHLIGDFARRFDVRSLTHGGARALLSSEMWTALNNAPWTGSGLRFTNYLFYGQYGHNSWLEIAVESGLLGTVPLATFYLYVVAVGIGSVARQPIFIPWAAAWLFLGGMGFLFSYFHHPFFWVLAGTVLGMSNPLPAEARLGNPYPGASMAPAGTVSSKRIAIFAPYFGNGGVERFATTLARLLQADGHRVDILTFAPKPDAMASTVPVINLGARRAATSLIPLLRQFWRERYDIVVSTHAFANIFAIIAARFLGSRRPKLLVTERLVLSASRMDESRWRHLVLGKLITALYPLADKVVCVSEDVRQDLIREFLVSPKHATVIHNPLDRQRLETLAKEPPPNAWLPPADGVLRVLAVGRLEPQKDYNTLLEAIAILSRKQPVHLTIVGHGSMAQALAQRAAELSVDVSFLGYCPNPYPLFRQCHVLAHSSHYEGLPNVVVEGMALGIPIVANHCPGGIDELSLGGKAFSVVKLGDAEGFAQKIATATLCFESQKPFVTQVLASFDARTCMEEYLGAV